MKDKILKTNVTQAVESLCKDLRAYSGESLVCNLTIISKSTGAATEDDGDTLPDWYKVRVVHTEAVDQDDSIINQSARIYYGPDEYGTEGIIKVQPYEEEEGEKDGP